MKRKKLNKRLKKSITSMLKTQSSTDEVARKLGIFIKQVDAVRDKFFLESAEHPKQGAQP